MIGRSSVAVVGAAAGTPFGSLSTGFLGYNEVRRSRANTQPNGGHQAVANRDADKRGRLALSARTPDLNTPSAHFAARV